VVCGLLTAGYLEGFSALRLRPARILEHRPQPDKQPPAGRRLIEAAIRFIDDHRSGVVLVEQLIDAA
jgi:hypothetical protein